MHDTCVFHSIGVHYMTHHTNLVVRTLLGLPLVIHLENLLQCLYSYFSFISKTLEVHKTCEAHGNRGGGEFLWNVKARWIFILNLTKKIMAKYRTLLVKMA
jgi:hypothetical protein